MNAINLDIFLKTLTLGTVFIFLTLETPKVLKKQ
jgi:hypothetical protein